MSLLYNEYIKKTDRMIFMSVDPFSVDDLIEKLQKIRDKKQKVVFYDPSRYEDGEDIQVINAVEEIRYEGEVDLVILHWREEEQS